MKKIIHYSDFLDVIGYALGECIGEVAVEKLSIQGVWGFLISLAICFAVGVPMSLLVAAIEKKRGGFKIIDVICAFALFVVFELLCQMLLHKEFSGFLFSNFLYYLVFGLLGFLVQKAVLYIKIRKLKKKYGKGDKGIELGDRVIQISEHKKEKFTDEPVDSKTIVNCPAGTFAGKKADGVISYKGIPYACDPVGDLRWKAPVPVSKFEEVYRAYDFSEIEPQPDSILFDTKGKDQGECCLSLNIWTSSLPDADKGEADKPVIVWFHGGDFTEGGSAFSLYDGTNIVDSNEDIVFVTFNYRFGIFGMMNFDGVQGGEEYAEAKDLILLDQIAALKWVKENIGAFGGNPDNITACGECAGADCLALLNVCDEARGLYKRAVMICPGGGHISDADRAAELTAEIMKELKLQNMSDFCNLSFEKLVKIEEKYYRNLNYPIVCEGMVSKSIVDDYAAGKADGIDIIVMSNKDDSSSYVLDIGAKKAEELQNVIISRIKEKLSEKACKTMEKYLGRRSIKEFICSLLYTSPAMMLCEGHQSSGNNAYFIYWKAASPIENFGAFSGFEVPFILENEKTVESYGIVGDNSIGQIIQKILISFATNGEPGIAAGLVEHNPEIYLEKKTERVPLYTADYDGLVEDDGSLYADIEDIASIIRDNRDLIKELYY